MNEPASESARQEAQTPVGQFAARLRQLRADTGSPTFRQLARSTHYSSSTLAEATMGRRLPSEQVVKAFVTACGADPEEWLTLLRETARMTQEQPVAAPPTAQEPNPSDTPISIQHRRLRSVALTAAGLLIGFGLGLGVFEATAPASTQTPVNLPGAFAVPSNAASVVPAPTTAHAVDGDDPAAAGCAKDAVLVDKSAVLMNGIQVGALEMEYSAYCGAGWTRIYLYPGQPDMLGFVQTESDDGRSSAFEDPLVKQVPAYTNVVVREPGGCLSGRAVFYLPGKPPAVATIACQAPAAH